MRCLNCQTETNNPKFCSMRCAAIVNNKIAPKRKPSGKCKGCQGPVLSQRLYCQSCKLAGIGNRFYGQDITIAQAIDKRNGRQNAFGLIRARARVKMSHVVSCQNCQYTKHIEIGHIKPISTFPLNTLLSVVNAPDNLIALCPNCHWEFDNGLLQL